MSVLAMCWGETLYGSRDHECLSSNASSYLGCYSRKQSSPLHLCLLAAPCIWRLGESSALTSQFSWGIHILCERHRSQQLGGGGYMGECTCCKGEGGNKSVNYSICLCGGMFLSRPYQCGGPLSLHSAVTAVWLLIVI